MLRLRAASSRISHRSERLNQRDLRGAVTIATGAGAFDLVAADINRDGRPDLAVANADANTVTILLGAASGLLSAFWWSTSASPRALVAGDFTRDGRLDLAVTAYDCRCVNIGAGNGDGTFATVHTFHVGANPEAIAADDFNRDGTLDLYVPSLSRLEMALFGRGDGTFVVANTTMAIKSRDIDVADFDRDGRADVVRVGDMLLQLQSPLMPHVVYGAPRPGRQPRCGRVRRQLRQLAGRGRCEPRRRRGRDSRECSQAGPPSDRLRVPWPRFATGSGARAVAAADVDGDAARISSWAINRRGL
jgi:FG-GAP-like repeat